MGGADRQTRIMPIPPNLPRRALAALIASAVAAAALAFAPAAAGAAEQPGGDDGTSGPAEPRTVTLITGDRVDVTRAADGKFAATVTPGEGRDRVTFQTTEVDGELQVLPSDAVPYLAAGLLDDDLFEVSTLIEQGYADLDALPLIVSWAPSVQMSTMSVAGATRTRALPSINGAALSAGLDDLDEVWQAITPGSAIAEAPGATADKRMSGGIDRVWLDGRATASLDRSVPQIGTPDAWAAGYRGDGVRVAVLDTGIDSTHPDFAGQIEEAVDFTESASGTADMFGHGTHVASTIAGTGAGAGGALKGVAPEADLLIGKVLGDDGSGYDSWIIAGMEWAAERAPVVNMSLGGGASDGTDPLSVALQSISERTGALFVVAAGNDGADEAVSTPSVAPAALSVAAVDRDESLAEFSSRGPGVNSGALKPEISAPGVAIVAARAKGTSMGEPVDALYTASSGTSMATPHVAGAAALLAQQHPDWDGARLKDALVSTARPNPELGVYEQGAGRVDLTRAVDASLTATGIADFAVQDGGDAGITERAITYRNDGDTELSLDLAVEMRNIDGGADGRAAFSAPTTVTVPAHASSDVAIRIDQSVLGRGRWSGALVATASDGQVVRTAIGAVKRGPRHTLTIRAIGFDGRDAFVPVLTLFGDHQGTDATGYLETGEVAELQVEEGDYIVQAIIEDYANAQDERTGTIILPEVRVTGDTEIVLDARKTVPIQIRTPEVSEPRSIISWYTHRVFENGRDIQHGVMAFERTRPWVTPTEKVSEGEFEFASRWQMVRPSAYLQVPGTRIQPTAGLLPESPNFTKPQNLELVAPGADLAGVRGKAVILDAPDRGDEEAQIAAAAEAGARAVILVRPVTDSIFTVFNPNRERMAVPAMVTTAVDGAALIAHANRSGAQHVKIDANWSSPYLYDVMQVSPDRIPEKIVHEVTARNSHRVTTTYVESGGIAFAREQRFGWLPWMTYAWNDAQRGVDTGTSREEWVSTGDSLWQHRVLHAWENWGGVVKGGMTGPVTNYDSGRSVERWFDPVVRPGAVAASPSTRAGDRMQFLIAEMVDAAGHWSVGDVRSEARLYRDGELVQTLPNARQSVDAATSDAEYRLELDVAREEDPEWQRGISTSTAWTFRSERPADGGTETLPLLQVGYDVPTDEAGSVGPRKHTIELRITDQLGAKVSGATVTVQLSYDDGATWHDAKIERGRKSLSVPVPAGTTPVSLRVTATDGSSSVVQEVIRAYDRG